MATSVPSSVSHSVPPTGAPTVVEQELLVFLSDLLSDLPYSDTEWAMIKQGWLHLVDREPKLGRDRFEAYRISHKKRDNDD